MPFGKISYIIFLSSLAVVATADAHVPKVAVVGAGIGGAFTAARIAELAPPDLQPEVDIFEAAEQEGGRVQEFIIDDEALELGASIFWDHNEYVKTAARRLGLRLRQLGGRGRGRQDVEQAAQLRAKEQQQLRQQQQQQQQQQEQQEQQEPGQGGQGVLDTDAAPPGDGAGAAKWDPERGGREGYPRLAERGFAVWNGSAFVINMTGSWSDTAHAALRYGTAALRYKWLVGDAFRRFRQVYDMQAAGTAWDTPEQLLRGLDLFNETQQRCSDYMRSWLEQPYWWLWGGAEFADEVAGAANRCNYNQNNVQMNAFAGLVSYMPAAYGAVWQIEGGNRQLVSGLLAASGARLVAPARVTGVRRRPEDGRYLLEVRLGLGREEAARGGQWGGEAAQADGGEAAQAAEAAEVGAAVVQDAAEGEGEGPEREEQEQERREEVAEAAETVRVFGPYDAVVIAAPLLGSEIQFDLSDGSAPVGASSETILQQPYQVTVTTYVAAGRLRPSYFNVARVPPVARVFVTSSARVPFSSLAVARPTGRSAGAAAAGQQPPKQQQQHHRVYKMFSDEEPSPELLRALFEEEPEPPAVLASRRWYAYPRFQPPERFSPFRLAPGLVYGNALEPAASAMEIAAIEAHNSALLVTAHLQEVARRRRAEEGEAAAAAAA